MHAPSALLAGKSLQQDTKPAAQPAVLATSPVSAQQHLSGYRLHPALMDATLHLSAAALPASGAKSGVTRIPAGLAAVMSVPLGALCRHVCPLAQPSAPVADGSVLCEYKLLAEGAGCPLQLSGLLAKEAGPMPAAGSAAAGAAKAEEEAIPESELLYETQWQAVSSLGGAAVPSADVQSNFALGRPARRTAMQGHVLTSGKALSPFPALPARPARVKARFSSGSAQENASSAVTRMLELWQRAAPDLAGGALALATQGAAGRGDGSIARPGSGPGAGAPRWALARVAASENPSVAVSGLDTDPAAPTRAAPVRDVCAHSKLAVALLL